MEAGDTLGEEGILEVESAQRKESAYAEQDTYLFEVTKDDLDRMYNRMRKEKNSLDAVTMSNYIKKQWVQKRSWRLYK